ncbi:MAG: type III pantothenate kinase [Phycisphaerales bacterium]|nr:type III pantothenate kinase [Phycisphaerales bacterium]
MVTETTDPAKVKLLLMDVGNTRVSLASWSVDGRGTAEHLVGENVDKVLCTVRRLWESIADAQARAMVVSSVCPPRLDQIRAGCSAAGIDPILVVGEHLHPPMNADVPRPEMVGTDRLCVAAAAYEKVRTACVVADFGTATTIDLIADNGVFLGGTIIPGMTLAATALHEHTAQLPMVDVGCPTEVLGKDTPSAIRNGIFAMMCGALREIVERYATDIGKWPILVTTGGDAEAIARSCDFVDHVVPDLCLDGLALAFTKFARQPED